MPDLSDCDPQRLQQLLDEELSPLQESEMISHIGVCDDCRGQLESFAADASWWQGTRSALSEFSAALDPKQDSDLQEAMEFAVQSHQLDFLAPSDNPAMLGRLGEFEILEWIGCGGMGIVLKGYDHELNRYVAVKVLHPHCATSAAARRRFAREAQAAAAVVHQHVVAIYAVDGQHHPPYLVMPFVPGESLQQRLSRLGPFEVIEVLRIGQQVAEGLAAAHAQGLVHRDIKPGNILLERNVDRVLLTDFGLARAADDASLTQSGVIAGTPQFMSPEQTRGEQVDHRTDLFSLGTVLYTLLAGHSPFRAETAMGVLRRVSDDTPRPLREINPQVPIWLEAFIAKLQAKQPSQRFDSASQVAEQLKQCLAHTQQPTLVPLPPEVALLTSAPPTRRGRTALRWLTAIMACSFLGFLVLMTQVPTVSKSAKTQAPSGESIRSEKPPSDQTSNWNDQHHRETTEIEHELRRLEDVITDHF